MNLTDNVIKIILRYYIFLYNHIYYIITLEKFQGGFRNEFNSVRIK